MESRAVPEPSRGRNTSTLWLLPAAALLLFVNGRWMIPAAAWLAPIFLLRYTRGRGALGLVSAYFAVAVVSAVAWRGLIPAPGAIYYGVIAAMTLAQLLPFVLDRMIEPRLHGFAATLVLPVAAVAVELGSAARNPYGTWGAIAYTQTHDLPLMQIVSVAGLYGISFLIHWTAAAINAAWETGFDWSRSRGPVLRLAAVLAVVHLWGGARLLAPTGDTTRVASFTVRPKPPLDYGDLLRRKRDAAGVDSLRGRLGALHDSLLAMAAREAAAGAKIVFWSETNGLVLKDDEAEFIARGERLAAQHGIYLGMALATFTPGEGYYENQLLIACPEGKTIARYHKANPVPGDPERGADKHLPVVETAYGRVAGAICFDADFPKFIREAGSGRAGLLIIPSSDWKDIDPIHTRMALVRGIENGCAVVRQTNQGLSAAADAYGRVLASEDFFHTHPSVMVSQVPTHRVRTVYRKVGELFAWICLGVLAVFAMVAIGQRGAKRFSTSATSTH